MQLTVEELDTIPFVDTNSSANMEVEGGNIRWFTYTGTEDIPGDVTHLIVDNLEAVPARLFEDGYPDGHPNLREVICRDVVKKIGEWAFCGCENLRRVIMPGVEVVENNAFQWCDDLTDVECGQLKIIRTNAFCECESLRSISLPSAEIFDGEAFMGCAALERVTVPLADNLSIAEDTFQGCKRLRHAGFVDGVVLRETQQLLLKKWRDSMSEQILSIDQILATTTAGYTEEQMEEYLSSLSEFRFNQYHELEEDEARTFRVGGKAQAIKRWVESVIFMLDHYKAEHLRYLRLLQPSLEVLPREIVMNNVLPFLD